MTVCTGKRSVRKERRNGKQGEKRRNDGSKRISNGDGKKNWYSPSHCDISATLFFVMSLYLLSLCVSQYLHESTNTTKASRSGRCIIPNLYLGNRRAAKNRRFLREKTVTMVLNCSKEVIHITCYLLLCTIWLCYISCR